MQHLKPSCSHGEQLTTHQDGGDSLESGSSSKVSSDADSNMAVVQNTANELAAEEEVAQPSENVAPTVDKTTNTDDSAANNEDASGLCDSVCLFFRIWYSFSQNSKKPARH